MLQTRIIFCNNSKSFYPSEPFSNLLQNPCVVNNSSNHTEVQTAINKIHFIYLRLFSLFLLNDMNHKKKVFIVHGNAYLD